MTLFASQLATTSEREQTKTPNPRSLTAGV